MSTTKYPKFRTLLTKETPRKVARYLIDRQVAKQCGLRLDDLPDTYSLCCEVDEMEEVIKSWEGNPDDGDIAAMIHRGMQVANMVVADEMGGLLD